MFDETLRDLTVVVIDDVRANLRLLQASLRAFGMRRIVGFSDSGEGLDWLQSNPWDLLLLDLDMPQPNGFELLAQLAGRDPSCSPVIIVTALSDVENRRKGLELGADDYVSKPLDLTELMLRVRSKLQLCHASRALKHERAELERKVASRTEQLRQSYEAMIHSLSMAATFRDNETGNHILRIGESAAMIAEALGQAPSSVELMRLAAPMHDIGKIGIPDHILLKPGRLSDDERVEMNRHPVIGYEILMAAGQSPLLKLAAEIAMHHHEKWDGSGYPGGLVGEAIPLSARIVALCDVYDALRSSRPYKQAWSSERALELLREQAGRHFDPALVEIFCRLVEPIELLLQRLPDEPPAGAGDRGLLA